MDNITRNTYVRRYNKKVTEERGEAYEKRKARNRLNQKKYLARKKALEPDIPKTHKSKTPEYRLWMGALHRARKNGREFTLTLGDITIPEMCPVFKTPMVSPSLDRVDNSKGYTKENVRVISLRANILKSSGSAEEFEAIISYIRSYPLDIQG